MCRGFDLSVYGRVCTTVARRTIPCGYRAAGAGVAHYSGLEGGGVFVARVALRRRRNVRRILGQSRTAGDVTG